MALYRSIGARKDPDPGIGTTAKDVRKGLAGLVSAGVLPGSTSPLVTGTAGFNYSVGVARWVTSRGTSDGVHLWGNDGAITVSTAVAPGAGLSRIDIIYALHPSNTENGDTDSVPVVAVAQGTAASTPVAPSIPTGALELARNTMTSAATSTASGGNTITQTAAVARLNAASRGETVTQTAASTGGFTASTIVADHGVIASATYDRVVECVGIINVSGITAGATWSAAITSSGSVVTTNNVGEAWLPFSTPTAIGGSATVQSAFTLAAGATAQPKLWLREIAGAGTCTIASGTLRVLVRPAG